MSEHEVRKLDDAAVHDDATAIKAYRAIADNYRRLGRDMGVASVIEALCDRLEDANRRIATGTNYFCDRAIRPLRVEFVNGRVVELVTDGDGPHLEITRR